jgi:gamma-glutamyltranspeptidase/glutathione hydrolase
LIANILQNTVNLLDFGLDIEASVHRPRFGGFAQGISGANYIEADIDEKVRKAAAAKGPAFHVVSPWHWMNGAFEGIWVDQRTNTFVACGDPRRTSHAEAA